MAFNDMLILECDGAVYGCRLGADGIEYYTQDASGNWVLDSQEVEQWHYRLSK
jgi:hypothetical protein